MNWLTGAVWNAMLTLTLGINSRLSRKSAMNDNEVYYGDIVSWIYNFCCPVIEA